MSQSLLNEYKLWTALVTPFDASGENVDYASLERLLKLQDKAGNGIALLGSTGEGISLKEEEQRRILEFAINLNLSAPIMVGAPAYNLYQAIEWLEFCKSLPIAAHLMTTPIYTKPGINGQTEWFEKLLFHANAPAMLYNIPSRAGVKLHPETIKNLYGHDKLWAIKDSSGSIDSLIAYKAAAPKVSIFCGDDDMMPAFAIEGAIGLVSVASNAWPIALRRYVDLCLSRALKEPEMWSFSLKACFSTTNPIPIKELLRRLKLIDHATMRLPLSVKDLPLRDDLDKAHQAVMQWEKKHA